MAADDRESPLEVKTKAETDHVPGHVGAKVEPNLSIQGTGVARCVEASPVGMQQAIELLDEIASGQAQKESREVQIGRQTVYWRIWTLVTEL